jgi:hypothetical protein
MGRWLLLVLLAPPAVRCAVAGSRLAGHWYGFEQRFHAASGRPLPVPEEYTPRSDLEWGTVPFGFQTALEFAGETVAVGEPLEATHTRELLWSGCFIEGPAQTSESWVSRRVPATLATGGGEGADAWMGWAASDAVDFSVFPLPYKSALRLAELRGETPRLGEVCLLAPGGGSLCLLHLAHSDTGALLVPVIATFLARGEHADDKALAKRLGDAAAKAADAEEADGAALQAGELSLADGLRLGIGRGEGGSFSVSASWRGAALVAQWQGGAVARVTPAEAAERASV